MSQRCRIIDPLRLFRFQKPVNYQGRTIQKPHLQLFSDLTFKNVIDEQRVKPVKDSRPGGICSFNGIAAPPLQNAQRFLLPALQNLSLIHILIRMRGQ